MRLFLDCDGVLADFDAKAREIFGMPSREYEKRFGTHAFWTTLEETNRFYRDMPVMPNAHELYNQVRHLRPTILTGCPRGGWAEYQKIRWAREHFPGVPMVTCPSREKYLFCHSGDVLIDDWPEYKPLWEKAGGRFIVYENVPQAMRELREHQAQWAEARA